MWNLKHKTIEQTWQYETVVLMVMNLSPYAEDVRYMGSVAGLRRCPGGGNDNPLEYSCLENPMDRGAWWATVHGVVKSLTRLKRLSARAVECFPGGACQSRRWKRQELDLWSGRSPGGGHGNPLQYSCLENSMDRGAWQATVHKISKSQTGLKQLSART